MLQALTLEKTVSLVWAQIWEIMGKLSAPMDLLPTSIPTTVVKKISAMITVEIWVHSEGARVCVNVSLSVSVRMCVCARVRRMKVGVEDQTVDTSTHLQLLLIYGQRSRLITDLFFKSQIFHTPRQVEILNYTNLNIDDFLVLTSQSSTNNFLKRK